MEAHEIRAAVAGVLAVATEKAESYGTGKVARSTEDNIDAVDLLTRELGHVQLQVPAGLSPQEVAQLTTDLFIGRMRALMLAFSEAFISLAMVHDAGDPEMRTADVVRDLALRWAEEANS